ncbi:MAG TPA: TlpA disulfide reductase family protein [Bryobacteraceae bacterium]|jgi:peroxiredoxin
MRIMSLVGVLSAALSFGADLPKQSPELVINYPSGEKQLLSKYRGKVVLVQFLFTTCPHCQRTAGTFSILQNELGSRGLQVVGVAFNEMSSMLVPDFVRDFKPSFPIGWADRDHVLNYLGLTVSDRFVVPQEVLIDRKGVIRMMSPPQGDANMQDEKYMRAKIEELLGGPVHAHNTPAATASKAAVPHH